MSRKAHPVPTFDPEQVEQGRRVTVHELADLYQALANEYYRTTDTKGQAYNVRCMLRPLREAASDQYADELDWQALTEHVQHYLAHSGRMARQTVNSTIADMRTMLRWAAKKRFIPASALEASKCVDHLKRGRSAAYETEPIKPATEEQVKTVAPYAGPVVEAMLWTQWHCGARPGEITIMRPCDIVEDGDAWIYRPSRHKTEHHGKDRVIYLGPKAQAWVRPWLEGCAPEAYLFSPQVSEGQRRATQRRKRKSYDSCGNRPGTNRKIDPKRRPAERYTTNSYAEAVRYACYAAVPLPADLAPRKRKRSRLRLSGQDKQRLEVMRQVDQANLPITRAANILNLTPRYTRRLLEGYQKHGEAGLARKRAGPQYRDETWREWHDRLGDERWDELQCFRREHHFTPNQLRHAAATRLRQHLGIDVARTVLGHSSAGITEIYAERDHEAARRAMEQYG
jgi:integrase